MTGGFRSFVWTSQISDWLDASTGAGALIKYDYEYKRMGVCNLFMANEPLAGQRLVEIRETKKKTDWACFAKQIAQQWAEAEKITLIMDNISTHKPGSLYEVFPVGQAKVLWDRFEFIYTPKHGSWLNMAEIELQVLNRQCLNQRIPAIQEVTKQVKAWQQARNNTNATINWKFTTVDAQRAGKRLLHLINIVL